LIQFITLGWQPWHFYIEFLSTGPSWCEFHLRRIARQIVAFRNFYRTCNETRYGVVIVKQYLLELRQAIFQRFQIIFIKVLEQTLCEGVAGRLKQEQ